MVPARCGGELLLSFILDNDAKYQAIYAERERVLQAGLDAVNSTTIQITIADRSYIMKDAEPCSEN